jgi:hypothetical protein
MSKLKEFMKVIFWVAVFIGGIYLLDYLFAEYDNKKADGVYKQLSRVCGVITSQQPNNIDLYDDCMNTGMEEFSPDSGN